MFHLSFSLFFVVGLSVSYGNSLYGIEVNSQLDIMDFLGKLSQRRKIVGRMWSGTTRAQMSGFWLPSPSLQASDSWADIVPIIEWISHGIFLKGFHKCSYFWKCSDMSCLYPAKGMAYFFKSSNSQVEKIDLTKVTKGRGADWIYCISSRFTEPGPTHRLAELAFLQVPKLSLLDMRHGKQKEKSLSFQLVLICLGSVGSQHAVGICGPKKIAH